MSAVADEKTEKHYYELSPEQHRERAQYYAEEASEYMDDLDYDDEEKLDRDLRMAVALAAVSQAHAALAH